MSNDATRRRQNLKKYLVFAAMFLLFLGIMCIIFAPSEKDRQEKEKNTGFNTELPDPRGVGIEEDKIAAYEQEDLRLRQEEKMRTLEDFSALNGEEEDEPEIEIAPKQTYSGGGGYRSNSGSAGRESSFASSTSAYNEINATLGSFYEEPKEDPEKEALEAEVEHLRQAMEQQTKQPTYEEQVALLEKSYELAAKYMPGNEGNTSKENQPAERKRNENAVSVGHVTSEVVTSLAQPVRDSAAFARLEQASGAGFHTAVADVKANQDRNTISACIHGDQTIISGQSVRMRLLEPMRVGGYVLPRNSLITGEGSIQGERLGIEIFQVEHEGTIIPVELTVFDSDGQDGIFIPGSMEVTAAKEVAANLGQNLGTSISITNQSAGDQLLSEVGRGAIQGVSQYISKKMREEKVHLKSGYTVMLYQNRNQ